MSTEDIYRRPHHKRRCVWCAFRSRIDAPLMRTAVEVSDASVFTFLRHLTEVLQRSSTLVRPGGSIEAAFAIHVVPVRRVEFCVRLFES